MTNQKKALNKPQIKIPNVRLVIEIHGSKISFLFFFYLFIEILCAKMSSVNKALTE